MPAVRCHAFGAARGGIRGVAGCTAAGSGRSFALQPDADAPVVLRGVQSTTAGSEPVELFLRQRRT